jgi:multidrug efflux pump
MAVRAGSWTREGRRIRDDFRLGRSAKKHRGQEILWDDAEPLVTPSLARKPIQPAE